MKKLISILLVFVMLLACLAACGKAPEIDDETTEEITTEAEMEIEEEDEEEDEEETTKKTEETKAATTAEVTTEPEITTSEVTTEEETVVWGETVDLEKDKMINVRDISFLGFKGWQLELYEDSAYLTKESTGSSISVMSEVDTGIYKNMSLEIYNTVYRPIYDEIGLNVVDVTIDKKTSANGIEVILLHQIFDIEGIEMSIDQLFVTEGNYTYVFALSMIEEVDVDRVISSIDYKNSTPPATAEESGDLIVGDLSVTYPEGWFVSEDDILSVFGDGEKRVVVATEDVALNDYENFDMDSYDEQYRQMYEAMGYVVESVNISRINSNGLSFLVIDQELLVGDYTMHLTEYIVIVGDIAYDFSFVNFESSSEELAVIATVHVVK